VNALENGVAAYGVYWPELMSTRTRLVTSDVACTPSLYSQVPSSGVLHADRGVTRAELTASGSTHVVVVVAAVVDVVVSGTSVGNVGGGFVGNGGNGIVGNGPN
jgi:hypothetical protein